MDQSLLVMSNLPDSASAEALARELVELRLAACVNILPGVRSIYRWQGAIEEANEVTVFIKTATHRYPDLEAAVRRLHPYEVPELIALPIAAGLPPYLHWIAGETRKEMDV